MKNSKVLSICIPTRNRIRYLRELLPNILRQAADCGGMVEVIVSDNASDDGTEEYLLNNAGNYAVNRHSVNVGAESNFLSLIEKARGKYVWVFGDDDLLLGGGVKKVLECIDSDFPDLVILLFETGAHGSAHASYGEYLLSRKSIAGAAALDHTLITSNVFRRGAFDMDSARKWKWSNYSLMFGIMSGMRETVGAVSTLADVIGMRETRAEFDRQPVALCLKQAVYLCAVSRWFGVNLRRRAIECAAGLPSDIAASFVKTFFPSAIGRIRGWRKRLKTGRGKTKEPVKMIEPDTKQGDEPVGFPFTRSGCALILAVNACAIGLMCWVVYSAH